MRELANVGLILSVGTTNVTADKLISVLSCMNSSEVQFIEINIDNSDIYLIGFCDAEFIKTSYFDEVIGTLKEKYKNATNESIYGRSNEYKSNGEMVKYHFKDKDFYSVVF